MIYAGFSIIPGVFWIKAGVFNEKTGWLVNLKIVNENEDIMVISNNGTIIRMHVSDISMIGRNTQGVRIMRLKDSEVATVAVAPREEEDDENANTENVNDSETETAENIEAGSEENSDDIDNSVNPENVSDED